MKKSSISFLLLLLAILPVSCGDELIYVDITNNTEAENRAQDELLHFSYTHSDDLPLEYQNKTNSYFNIFEDKLYYKSKSVYYRLDPRNGFKTTVCSDPVCSHDTFECPAFSISSAFYVHDGVFYFDRLTMIGAETKEVIVALDLSSGKTRTLYDRSECSNQYVQMMIYDGYLYFYKSYFEGEDENKKYIADISAVNIESGKVIDVIKYEDSVYDYLIGGEGGYLFLCDPFGGIFKIKAGTHLPEKEYLFTFEGEELADYDPDRMALSDGYIYYYTSSDNGTDFRRIPTSGGEPQIFAEDSAIKADYCLYTHNYIYYSSVSKKLIGKTQGEDLYCDVYDIRRVSYTDGICEEVFRDFPEGFETYSIAGGYIVSGNYIYTHTWDWGELKEEYLDGDCRYDSGYSGVIARIDIQTGEVRYIGS